MWLYGLARVGPLRTVLLSEHSDIVLLACWGAVIKGVGGPRKLRGSLWFFIGILSLLLFDNDSVRQVEHPEGQIHHGVQHVAYYLLAWTGLSDHEGGIVVLLISSVLQVYANNQGKRISVEIGGAKRLRAISALVSVALLLPASFLTWYTQDATSPNIMQFFPQAFVVALFVFVLHYYIESACVQRLDVVRTARFGSLAMIITCVLISFIGPSVKSEGKGIIPEHAMSGGVVFSFIMFSAASLQLTSSKDMRRGLGGGESGLPLYGLRGEAFHRPHSFVNFASSTFKDILADRNSRTIFYFLCLNLGFTFVELIYGMWTNSLGLISDGFHMLFDCSALVMGLCAAVMARWKPTKTFPFGYGRIEILSGFVNGLFLTVIGVMVLYEAVCRLFEPPQVKTEKLLIVAVCGLIVNLIGIMSFSHTHSHSHSAHGHSHNHQGHIHGHGHSQGHQHGHSHGHNANMQGVFLHIVADTMGSIAVIISSLLIDWYGWLVADPLCSIVLAALILASVFPLLMQSAAVLVLRVPHGYEDALKNALNQILQLDGVISYSNPRFWQHSGDTLISNITVQCTPDAMEQRIIHQVTKLVHGAGFNHVTVQVEVVPKLDAAHSVQPNKWSLGTVARSTLELQKSAVWAI
ncbi:proton-coupled zinc antiporter SLC30A5-like isoform X3 [Oratosquilla oratoria]